VYTCRETDGLRVDDVVQTGRHQSMIAVVDSWVHISSDLPRTPTEDHVSLTTQLVHVNHVSTHRQERCSGASLVRRAGYQCDLVDMKSCVDRVAVRWSKWSTESSELILCWTGDTLNVLQSSSEGGSTLSHHVRV